MSLSQLLVIVNSVVFFGLLERGIVNGAKIIQLGIQFPSHFLVQMQLGSALAEKGHEVHMVMASRFSSPDKLREVGIQPIYYDYPDDILYGISEDFQKAAADLVFNNGFVENTASMLVNRDCTIMMDDKKFLDKVKSLKFDLAIAESFVYAPCNLILPKYLGIPYVSFATIQLPWEMRLPALPSFHRILGWYPIVNESSIVGRTTNLISYIIAETSILIPGAHDNTLLQRYTPEFTSWKELIRQSELIMTDIDHHMGIPLPQFPYHITIPGLSVKPPEKLDPQLETLMNANEDGIVLMTLGSMVHHIPRNITVKFFKAFSQLKQTVLARMKVPDSGMVIPSNVKLLSWLPQNDILGHSNTRLFLTHGGNSGQHEMLFHGVPFVCVPMFADQEMNCHHAEQKGFGIKLNLLEFTSDELYKAMDEVINNSKYKSTIKRASVIFRDQPMNATEKAVFWIEHVIKYGGRHLRSSALDLPLYQFLMLDVIALFMIFSYFFWKLLKVIVTIFLRNLFRTNLFPIHLEENSKKIR